MEVKAKPNTEEDMEERRCEWCSGPMPARAAHNAKWCSDECRKAARNAQGRAERAAQRARDAERRICAMCGAPLPAKAGPSTKYCPTCQQLAARDKRATCGNRRRAAKYSRARVSYSSAELRDRRALFGGACWVCGATAPLEVDHVVPLQPRKGTADPVGGDRLDNFAEMCGACNRSKSNRAMPGWLPGRLAKLNGTTRKAEQTRLDALVTRATGRPAADVWRAFYAEPVDYATVDAVIRVLACAELTAGPAPQTEAVLHTGDGECEHCGGPIPRTRRENALYCSKACAMAARNAQYRARRAARRADRACPHCGAPIPTTRPAHARYCSDACKAAAHSAHRRKGRAVVATVRRADRKCQHCGAPIPPALHENARYCSKVCKWEADRTRARERQQQAHALAA